MGRKIVDAASKLAAKGFSRKGKATASKPTSKATASKPAQVARTLDAAMLKMGKVIWSTWTTRKLYVPLGIREKTATGTGTRAAMLAVAAYGYKQGEGKLLAQAVRAAMGLDPNVGGIDFPWLEKAGNIATITSGASVRLDSKDGKLRLLPITGSGKARKVAATVAAKDAQRKQGATVRKARKPRDVERANGAVTVRKATPEELAAAQASA